MGALWSRPDTRPDSSKPTNVTGAQATNGTLSKPTNVTGAQATNVTGAPSRIQPVVTSTVTENNASKGLLGAKMGGRSRKIRLKLKMKKKKRGKSVRR